MAIAESNYMWTADHNLTVCQKKKKKKKKEKESKL